VRTLAADTLDVRVGATVTTVTVQGEIAAGRGPFLAEFSHPDPVALFASVLRAELARAGVDLAGGVRRERGAAGGPVIAVLRSPVADALEPINTDSRNGVADQLFLALGLATFGQGSREAGRAATAGALERLGVASAGLVQVDGSGLSRDDRASARQIAALVAAVLALEPATALAFVDSLAVAGRTGTLAERMRGAAAQGRVFAKTGWISGASALSGVANALDGRELVFSILVAYPAEAGGLNSSCFKPMQDEMVALLVEDAP
jgi:D-alanyl-D-alanine carboxypeptidase/D-alanyl-D-alanine-endopeptidase (penicillin-binding protein 4)